MRLRENSYPWVFPSAISTILYTKLRRTEDVACHRTWVTGLFQLQHQVPPVLVFALAGIGLWLERGSASTIQSQLPESVRNVRDTREARTVSTPAEKRSCKCRHVLNPRILNTSPVYIERKVLLMISSCFWRPRPTKLSNSCRCSLASD
jgi:hypothetical protein